MHIFIVRGWLATEIDILSHIYSVRTHDEMCQILNKVGVQHRIMMYSIGLSLLLVHCLLSGLSLCI